MNRLLVVAVGLPAIALTLLTPGRAGAIAAFARQNRVSCSLCHAPIPRLTPYGEEFALRGYRDEAGARSPPEKLDAADPLLALPRDFPVALRLDAFADWSPQRDPQADFETPTVLKAIAGGPIAPHVSFYTYFIVEDGEAGGIEDAWVAFTEVGGLPLDVTLGQFQVSDPVVKRELRLLRSEYEILTARPRLSRADLTYDRGLMLTWHAPAEVEAFLLVTNGSGIGPAAGAFDADRFKDFALRLQRPFGPVRVGLFSSVGKAFAPGATTGPENTTFFWGPDLRVDLGEWGQLAGQWLSRHDSNAAFDPANTSETNTRGYWVELVLTPQGSGGRTAVAALYNRVESDDPAADRHSVGLGGSWLVARNVRLAAEVQGDLEAESLTVSAGTVLGF
jgi:hypothetical protein